MGGVFINYRRGEHHICAVRAVRSWLAGHFGADQVFLDERSIVPGERYPDVLRERLADCDVLLVVIHKDWLNELDDLGSRRLDHEDDWVRLEIRMALQTDKVVIPLILGGAEVPSVGELPKDIRGLALANAHFLNGSIDFLSGMDGEQWKVELVELTTVLESHVAPTWQPYPCPEPQPRRPQRQVVVAAGLLAIAMPLATAMSTRDSAPLQPEASPPPAFMLTMLSLLGMAVPLLAVGSVRGLFRRGINTAECWLHGVSVRRYFLLTWVVPCALVFLGAVGGILLFSRNPVMGLPLLLVLIVMVMYLTVEYLRADKREREQWTSWPTCLPEDPLPRRVLRRAIARLEERMGGWTQPLTREQGDKALWELQEIARALAGVQDVTQQPRLRWLTRHWAWQFIGYILWISATTSSALVWTFPLAAAETAPWFTYTYPLAVTLVGSSLALGTMEVVYRHERWLGRMLQKESKSRMTNLRKQVVELGSRARVKPSWLDR